MSHASHSLRRVSFFSALIGVVLVLSIVAAVRTIEAPATANPQTATKPPITTLPNTGKLRPVGPALRIPMALLRGYLAVHVSEPQQFKVAGASVAAAHDIYIPGVLVWMEDAIAHRKSEAVHTDLSGRFTLALPAVRTRVRICWKSENLGIGCDEQAFPFGDQLSNIGIVRIPLPPNKKTAAVYGTVSMNDGTAARAFDPMANINSFSMVELLDSGGKTMDKVYVNNLGEYLLPRVPGKTDLTLRASMEAAHRDHPLYAGSNLLGAAFQKISLTVGNKAPRLDPVVPLDDFGIRVKTALVGSSVHLKARATDADGDPLKFKWEPVYNAGTLSTPNDASTDWKLPSVAGRYALNLYAWDGKGGYAKSSLSLRVDSKGEVPFGGLVRGTDAPALAGAVVEVNGVTATTGPTGTFWMTVKDAPRFVLNIRRDGYGFYSKIYDNAVTSGRWTLTRATVITVDPTHDIVVVNERSRGDCPGPDAARLNWRQFPNAAVPQWQDGKGNVIRPPRRDGDKDRTPGATPYYTKGNNDQKCGPGIRVKIPANSLVDSTGSAPTGPVRVTLSTVDLRSPEQMPGDYTVRGVPENGVMQSWGAGTVDITDAVGRRYNLRPGSAATVTIPVDPSQLAGGPLPATIPILHYDERAGVWIEDGKATLAGTEYVAEVKHFSSINTDLVKTDQSCVEVISPSLPTNYNLEVTIPMPGGAAPRVLTRLIDNSPPSDHVLYNLPSNTDIVIVPVSLVDNTPIGTFIVNTGGKQNPTSPNLPAGPPYVACSTRVTLTQQAYPDDPTAGFGNEFLQGIDSGHFEATNINELNPANPSDAALATAIDQATANYYEHIDPRHKRLTLMDFKNQNTLPAGEINVVYANGGDLGFGRDMHCKRNGLDVACYVTNYGNILTPDATDVHDAVTNNTPVATVAMEYSQIESAIGQPTEFDDPERVVKFYVYKADGTLARSADLDSGLNLRKRPVPQLCMVCHSGVYPGGTVLHGAPPFNSRDDVKLGSRFLPFDLHYYVFDPAKDKASQQLDFKNLNQNIVKNTPPDTAIADLIDKLYAVPGDQNENAVVDPWNTTPLNQGFYRDVVARACRTCHVAQLTTTLKFSDATQFINRLGAVESRVCVQHVMPHSKVTHRIFWQSVGPHMPAQLEAFGVSNPGHGFVGNQCSVGGFTPGGTTPASVFNDQVQPIFDTRCVGCHSGSTPSGGLNLDQTAGSYTNIVNVPALQHTATNYVTPSDFNLSYLYRKILGTQAGLGGTFTNGGPGQRMPFGCSGASCLSTTQSDTIRDWIATGALP
jgi:hypothetical protein